jgi:glyoxylase-like metal-dependent hydrolase (beta-lactamase superfamily II)
MKSELWTERAEGIFVRSYEALEVNICVIRGDRELLVIDSRSSPTEGSELKADLHALAPAAIVGLVNTHAHFDHTFGNQAFSAGPGVPIYGHHRLPSHLAEYEAPRLMRWREGSSEEPTRDWHDVTITAPTVLIREDTTLLVGSRVVELIPQGAGHTDSDLVVHIPDVNVWVVGDVVEASGPPMFGSGCFPLEFPQSLGNLLDRMQPTDIVVPGHGPVVDRAFVSSQHLDLTRMALQLRAEHATGATIDEALAHQRGWPFPVENLRLAVTRAFNALDNVLD